MRILKILVPTDFSDSSDAALTLASSLARDNGAQLIVIHVHERDIVYTGFGAAYAALPPEKLRDSKYLLQKITPASPEVDFERRMLEGSPAESIVQFAEQEQIDLIVLGTHGRTGLDRLLMGSVAEVVVRKAPCPVLTIKQPARKTADAS